MEDRLSNVDNSSPQSVNRPRTIQLSAPKITVARTSGATANDPSLRAETGSTDSTKQLGITAAVLSGFERITIEPQDVVTLAADAVRLASQLPRVVACGYLVAGQDGGLKVAASSWTGFAFERAEFRKGLLELCSKVSRSHARENFSSNDLRNVVTWCIPLGQRDSAADVFAVSVSTGPNPISLADHQLIEHLITALRTWHANRHAEVRDAEMRSLAALVELVGMIERSKSLSEACHAVANEVQKFLQCHRVAVAMSSRGSARLRTISGLATFDVNSETARQFQAASDEAFARQSFASWPPLNPNAEHSLLALKRLAEMQNASAAVAVPLRQNEHVVGTLIVSGVRESLLENSTVNLLRTSAPILGSALSLAKRLDGNWLTRSVRRVTSSRWSSRIAVMGTLIAITSCCAHQRHTESPRQSVWSQ